VRALAITLAAFALAADAAAAPPVVTATASPGAAPLRVSLTASGDAASYHWDFGDGTTAEGAQVTHVYAAGRFVTTVTATGVSGETAQAFVEITVGKPTLSLRAPRVADHGTAIIVSGRLQPARRGLVRLYRAGQYVTAVRSGAGGHYRAKILLLGPGPYEARFGAARSVPRTIRVRPRLETTLAPTAPLHGELVLSARLVPPAAGKVQVIVRREGRIVARRVGSRLQLRLPTRRAAQLRIALTTRPRIGYVPSTLILTSRVVLPSLALGAQGPTVLALERRLAELRYALRAIDSLYAMDTLEAVLAFQKVHRLPRTGRVDAALWRRLAAASTPRPRYGGGDRIEVDKTRQVLFEIRAGKVARIVHVSTGSTGNTPLGRWQVYRRVPGFDWVLWYPLYFLRGFAIHGYPSVPAYPASHGCVRVPMWIAPSLYARHGYGAAIVVYA